jgi:tetratricopeptide (TPR) repeat protein
MLTGRLPFQARTLGEFRERHLYESPTPPSTVTGVDHRLSAIALKCLEKRLEQRFANFAELAKALEAYGRSSLAIPTAALPADVETTMTALDWKWHGGAWNRLRDGQQALECAKRALEADPHVSHLRLDLSIGLVNLGRHTEAVAYEQQEEALYSQNPEFHQQMAIKFSNLGEPASALAAARKAVELGPDLPKSWELFVLCAGAVAHGEKGKDFARAVLGLQLCFDMNPNATMYEWMTSACYFGGLRHYIVAGLLHSDCVSRFPKAATNWYNFGVTYHKWGKLNGALGCYTKAIELKPSFLALVNRGWIHLERQDPNNAERDWRLAVVLDADHVACGIFEGAVKVGLQKISQNSEFMRNFKKLHELIGLAYDL